METLLAVLETAGGFFLILAVCFTGSWLVRRRSGCHRDRDLLEHMAHGCAGCQGGGACQNSTVEKEHHELA